jgi:sigma-B regulation protein RsbU (phosphoserine phosphatase)
VDSGMNDGNTGTRKTRGDDRDLHRVFMDDIRRTHFGRDYLREFKDLYYFYLDDERRTELAGMGRWRRAFLLLAWILKSLLLKLSPARRLLLLAALVLTLLSPKELTIGTVVLEAYFRPWGFLLLLIVLMLELRDKLLARDEIAVARQVQIALLPDEHPDIPGWTAWYVSRPANDVGGDLVDYLDLDGFRHGIVLGDVAGKGLGAALLSAKLQATLRALVPAAVSLDELGGRVNDIFHKDGLDNRYATLFLAELEHDSGHVRYLNAGHNPPMILRSDHLEKLPASSYPLGMLGSATYEEIGVELAPGDVMLAYSDGLTEATNENGEEFGVGRLEKILPELRSLAPEAIGRRILVEVDRFLGEARLGDDLSLVIVKR